MYKLLYVVLLIIGSGVYAAGIPQIEYLKKHDFLAQTFEQPPKWKMLRLKGDVKKRVEAILKHPYSSKRIRYWRDGARSAWIIDEIGKEMPITMGLVVNGGAIENIEIMVYREERGGEVHQAFFTKQFEGMTLIKNGLSAEVDGITGATLSVDAVTRVAAMVLYLDQYVQSKKT